MKGGLGRIVRISLTGAFAAALVCQVAGNAGAVEGQEVTVHSGKVDITHGVGTEPIDEVLLRADVTRHSLERVVCGVFGEQQVLEQRWIGERQSIGQTASDRERLQHVGRLVRVVQQRQAEADAPYAQSQRDAEDSSARGPQPGRRAASVSSSGTDS